MIGAMIVLLLFSGCSTVIEDNKKKDEDIADAYDLSFSASDSDADYDINGSTYIALGNDDVKINEAGTYILEGALKGSIIVEVSDDEDVRLVLNGVTIDSGDFAGIYIIEGDEITITLAEGSVNSISDAGTYTQIDDNDVDALIYSKADLIINGSGTLKLDSSCNHGIVSKDNLIICGGRYEIDVAGQGIKGKDCLMISDGDFVISSGKDALKSDNDEDEYRGYVNISGGSFMIESGGDGIYGYSLVNIQGGTFDIRTVKSSENDSFKAIKSDLSITISGGDITIDSADDGIHSDGDILISSGKISISSNDDGIHGDGKVTIDGGDIEIDAHEGIEATYVLINDGDISISASDDGINAAQKSDGYTATFEINGGYLKIDMGQGDTDAIDSNGYLYINGGTLEINAQFPFDYDREAQLNGGTLIVNGTETYEITNQFMGGFGGPMQNHNSNGFGNWESDDEQRPEWGQPGDDDESPDSWFQDQGNGGHPPEGGYSGHGQSHFPGGH